MTDLLAAVGTDETLQPYAESGDGRSRSGCLGRVARSSIRLRPYVPDSAVPLGGNKVGGHPDVPPEFVWPTRRIEVPEPSPAFREVRQGSLAFRSSVHHSGGRHRQRMAGLLRPDDVLYWLLYFEFGDCFEECDHDTGPPFDEILREAIRTISEPCGMLIKITAASAKARDEPFEIVLGGRRDDTPRSMDWRDLLPGIIGSFVGVMGWLLVGLYIQRRQFVRQARNAAKAVYFELDVNRAAIDVARQHGLFANLDRTSFERLLPELATLLSAPDLRIVVDAYMTHAGYGQLASRGELPADVRRAALSTFLGVHGRALEKLQQCAFTTAEAHAIVTKPHEPDAADARESIVRTAP